MAKYYYNGVLLPEIPTADYDGYTYLLILKGKSDGNLYIYASNTKPYQQTKSSVNRLELPGGRTRSWYSPDTGWDVANVGTSSTYCNLTETWEVVWSNYDIPSGSATATEIYFYGSDPVPMPNLGADGYVIQEETLAQFADQARRLGGVSGTLTTAEMLEIFGATPTPT